MRALVVAAVLAGACGRAPRVTSCADDLGGVWRADGGGRWIIADRGKALEIYPDFDDAPPGEVVAAPRWMALARTGATLSGELRRRFMRRADACEARTEVHVTHCEGDVLELVLVDPPPPLAFAPCRFPPRPPAHVERWRRQ